MNFIERFKDRASLVQALMAQAIVQGDIDVATALAAAGQLVEHGSGEVLIPEITRRPHPATTSSSSLASSCLV